MILSLYRSIMTLGEPLIERVLANRLARGREDPVRIGERRGVAAVTRPEGQIIWLHAASVGESIGALGLMECLLKRMPDSHLLVTTGTLSSAELLAKRLPERAIHQFVPVDRPAWVTKFLDYWKPDLSVVMESDFWPNLILETHRRHIPICVVNGRMSASSFNRWRWSGVLARPLFQAFELVLTANEAQAERFRSLGSPEVEALGNIKLAAPPPPIDGVPPVEIEAGEGRPIWLAASTHEGEETAALDAHEIANAQHPNLLTIIAPRHPARADGVAETAQVRGWVLQRRSSGEAITSDVDIFLVDTLGELGRFFDLAPVVFVAGSFVPVGGHNPIEPAHYDCAILFGPLMSKNIEIADEMKSRGAALEVSDATTLGQTVARLLSDEAEVKRLAEAARGLLSDHLGVTDTVARRLTTLLEARAVAERGRM
ncbi:MAG: 3-deoxy-D-manno-octulosonic acid transferase [Rhodospirillaceae bacterium]|nr:3-deoxy-D-manno-octulosonic acid transferase [Rhodospirillaceae bacterium]